MSEYIGWLDDEYAPVVDMAQEIVRCRDCKNYEPKDGTWLNCRFEIDGFIQWRYAEPDGFCKWGEKKEGGE